MEALFRYRVIWHDANGAGEAESGVQYEGFCRQKALSEKRLAEESSCGASITVLVPGPKGWYSPCQKKWEEEEDQMYQEDFGPCHYDKAKRCNIAYLCGLCPIANK